MNRRLKNLFWRGSCLFFSLFFPLNKKKVFFRAYNGLQYACNPRAISEKLHELAPYMEIVWGFNNPEKIPDLPSYAKKVKRGTFADYREMFTSKFWVFNAGIILPHKRTGQYYMDTWHGDRAFKCVTLSSDKKTTLKEAYKNADVVLSGSDYGDKVFRESLQFSGEILHSGSPRNDIFFCPNVDLKNKIRQTLSLEIFDSLLMYAPTFRDTGKEVEPLDFSHLLDLLEKRDQKKWGCLIRQHHKTPLQSHWGEDPRIKDVSLYGSIQELLLIADVVISDYSSLVGDFVLLKRPVVLYVPDLADYKSGRGLNFDIEKSPFFYAKEGPTLFQLVENLSAEAAKQNGNDILDFYGSVCENGTAAEQACKWILERV